MPWSRPAINRVYDKPPFHCGFFCYICRSNCLYIPHNMFRCGEAPLQACWKSWIIVAYKIFKHNNHKHAQPRPYKNNNIISTMAHSLLCNPSSRSPKDPFVAWYLQFTYIYSLHFDTPPTAHLDFSTNSQFV